MHAQLSRTTPPARCSDGSAVMQYHPRDQDFEKILSGYSERGGLARSEQLTSLLHRQQRAHVMNATRMVASGHIFSFEWDRTAWIPMFQFETSDMHIKRGPRRVLSELTQVLDRWELALWFIQPNSWLKGRQPLDVMDEDLPAVLNAARSDRFVASGQPVFSEAPQHFPNDPVCSVTHIWRSLNSLYWTADARPSQVVPHARSNREFMMANVADKAKSLPEHNHLLASLPAAELKRWLPDLEWVEMPLGHVVYESGKLQNYVYFPTTAIVSLLYVLENGASAEIAVVGNEGLVGVSLFMGGGSTPSRAVVQSAGQGFRLKAQAMKDEFDKSGPVLHLLLRYTQALITQMSQTAVCNRHHSLDQQLCRWLLLSMDRLQGNELVMTQELIANMLGVRREGVTEGATKLQQAGLIKYSRGRITVLNRPGLEERTCECYAVVKKEYDRLLPAKQAI